MNMEKLAIEQHEEYPPWQTEDILGNLRHLDSLDNNERLDFFENLDSYLQGYEISQASQNEVVQILNDSTLACRSEAMGNALALLTEDASIPLENDDRHANMCTMSYSEGFKTALSEGFSGKDVNNFAKAVISFSPDHVETFEKIPPSDALWETKPQTAQVSRAGRGMITPEDVKMLSLRFPVRFFPEELFTERERERLENGEDIKFIIRHFTSEENTGKEKSTH